MQDSLSAPPEQSVRPVSSLSLQAWCDKNSPSGDLHGRKASQRFNPLLTPHLDIDELAFAELPADFRRTSEISYRTNHQFHALSSSLTATLTKSCVLAELPISVFLLAGFHVLLHRYTSHSHHTIGLLTKPLLHESSRRVLSVAEFSGPPCVRQMLAQLGRQLVSWHPDIPTPSRDLSCALDSVPCWFLPLHHSDDFVTGGLETMARRYPRCQPSLLLIAKEGSSAIELTLEYNSDVYHSKTIEHFLHRYIHLIEHMLMSSDLPVTAAQLEMSAADRRANTAHPLRYPRHETVISLFRQRASEFSARSAIQDGNRIVRYQDLERWSTAIAHQLVQAGVTPGSFVGLCLPRSAEMLASILGILKAGAAYVPLDPHYPAERLRFIAEDAGLTTIVGQHDAITHWVPETSQVIAACLAPDTDDLVQAPDIEIGPDDVAYLCYTSGTTGTPKGAMIPHRGIVHLVLGAAQFPLTDEDRVAQLASIAFDAATLEIWAALLHGGCSVLYPDAVPTASGIRRLVRAHSVSAMVLTTSVFKAIASEDPGCFDGINQLVIGGEALPIEHVRRARAASPKTTFINGYGPTEATCMASAYRVVAEVGDWLSVPIGTPVGETRAYVLDEHYRTVPVGMPGDLYLAGPGLALGYWRRPALTAQRFMADPFESGSAAVMYKTGDRVRLWSDGNLEFLGRDDSQVKVRGFRIELGEIEAVLRTFPGVDDALVVVGKNFAGEDVLVAYVATASAKPDVTAFLTEKLPGHMIPSACIALPSFPRTRSGKIDTRALPPPRWGADDSADRDSLWRTNTERQVAQVWRQVLGVTGFDLHDTFAVLGGHSLLATQAIVHLRSIFQADFPLQFAFDGKTVPAMAALIDQHLSVAPQHDTIALARIAPAQGTQLSFSQERVWFIQEMYPHSKAYNTQVMFRFSGALRVDSLRGALNEIIDRHDIFRTTVDVRDGIPFQKIHPPTQALLVEEDLRLLSTEQRAIAVNERVAQELATPFDMYQLPLVRWTLLRTADEEHVLIQVEHHLVHDGWSFLVLLAEMLALYRAKVGDASASLPPLPIQFADFAHWQRQWMKGQTARQQLAYWQQQLHGAPPLWSMPLDRPRPPKQSMTGGALRIEMDAELADTVRQLARDNDATLFQVTLAAYVTLLHRYTGEDDLCIGTGIANRSHPWVEKLIGMVINTLALRIDIGGKPTFVELIRRVKQVCQEAYSNQDVPFDQVVDVLAVERNLSYSPVYQTTFSFHDAPMPDMTLPDVTISMVEGLSNGSAKFDLSVILIPRVEQNLRRTDDTSRGITMVWEYSTDLFDEPTIHQLVEHYQNILTSAVATPQAHVGVLPLCDLKALVRQHEMNSVGDRANLGRPLVHQQVAACVRVQPEAIAVIDGESTLTYQELVARSRQLAARLRSRGVQREEIVAIFMDHCAERVVAQLAVLQAGAAFVLVDPKHPEARTRFIVSDCQTRIVLVRAQRYAVLDVGQLETIGVEEATNDPLVPVIPDGDVEIDPDTLAYVIYTSGSTGDPKGVLVEHRNLCNLVDWYRAAYAVTKDDRGPLLAGLSFDASILECWPLLVTGACLHVVPVEYRVDPDLLRSWMIDQSISIAWVPTAIAEPLISEVWPGGGCLTRLLTGGDRLNSYPAADTPFSFYNLYGPTECTVVATHGLIPPLPQDGSTPTIGVAIANTQVYIFDPEERPVPDGVPGELVIAGDSVARGYLRRDDVTARKFIADPFSTAACRRMYKTGDRARYRSDGTLEFLGRLDQQVKLRGFRIELGEIDAAIAQHPGTKTSITVLRDAETSGGYLISYVVTEGGPTEPELRELLASRLPQYMVPSFFVFLDALPVTRNGKIDTQALPPPHDSPSFVTSRQQGPRTELEELLCEIWMEILERDNLTIFEDFFLLGGHSLTAARIVARVRKALSIDLSLQAIFDAPTVAGLASYITAQRRSTGSRPPRVLHLNTGPDGWSSDTAPLSFSQRRLWRMNRQDPRSSFHNICRTLRIQGRLDVEALRQSFQELVDRHDMLRAVFYETDGTPAQQIRSTLGVTITRSKAIGESLEERVNQAYALAYIIGRRPFDLAIGPLFHIELIDLGDNDHVLVFALHHIIVDGWSMRLLTEELRDAYRALTNGELPSFPSLAFSYADYARWQHRCFTEEVLADSMAYWREQLRDAPTDIKLPRTLTSTGRPDQEGRIYFHSVSRDLASAIRSLARDSGATPYIAVLSIFFVQLYLLSGREDFLVVTSNAARIVQEIEPIVGFFVNPLVLRARVSGSQTFCDLLRQTRQTVLAAQEHQEAPFDQVLALLAEGEQVPRSGPPFQFMFDYQKSLPDISGWPGVEVGLWQIVDKGSGMLDLALGVEERADGGLMIGIQYGLKMFSESDVAAIAKRLVSLMEFAVANPERRLASLDNQLD
jgi:amino acid adenylation domain-containing protein